MKQRGRITKDILEILLETPFVKNNNRGGAKLKLKN